MSDFFATLELELRNAAVRAPGRRAPALRTLVPAALVTGLLALALVTVFVWLGDGDTDERTDPAALAPVGTVYEPREGTPPRHTRSTVVATGLAPVAGPWQMETYTSTRLADPKSGEEYQPAGLRCLGVYLLDPPNSLGPTGGGQCGEFPRTPGFSRVQMTVRNNQGEAREILVYGRAPPEARAVVITVDGESRRAVKPFAGPPGARGDFYLIPIPPEWERGRVNWLDDHGNEGSRGHALMPR